MRWWVGWYVGGLVSDVQVGFSASVVEVVVADASDFQSVLHETKTQMQQG